MAVFEAGCDEIEGVPNAKAKYSQYREQNIVVTKSGRAVAICQARNHSGWSDRSGQDLVCKWSDDHGQSWSKAKLMVTHGLKSICPNAAVYDRDTDRIHVLYNLFMWDFDKKPPKHVSGEMGETECRQYVITSSDEGKTWSKPREISSMLAAKGAVAVFGSGAGMQLKQGKNKGRLLVPGGDFYQGKKVFCYISDDHGKSWRSGTPAPLPGKMAMASETKVAELSDGTIVLNSRSFHKDGGKQRLRTRAFSKDGGQTWSTLENDPALKTVSCNGGLMSVKGKDGDVVMCSVPVGPGRTHGTVYFSHDGGKTWPKQKLLVPGTFAYSSLVQFADGTLGCFYESRGHKDIRLVKFEM